MCTVDLYFDFWRTCNLVKALPRLSSLAWIHLREMINFLFFLSQKFKAKRERMCLKFQMDSCTRRVSYWPLAKLYASGVKKNINSVFILPIIPCKKSITEKLTEFLPWQWSQILELTIGYEPSCYVHGFIPDLRSTSTKVSRGSSGSLAHPLQSDVLLLSVNNIWFFA